MRVLLVELTEAEAANASIVKNIVAAFDLKSVDVLTLSPPCEALSAAQVFGGAPSAPLAPAAAPAAPSTAVAEPTSTALEDEQGSTPAGPAVFGALAATAVATAKVAPPAPAPMTSPAGVELDASGFPWDYRIHAEGKAKLKDGTWRQKRNTAPEKRQAVEAELRANGFPAPGGTAAPAPAAPVAASAPVAPPAPVTPPLTDEQKAQLAAAAQQAAKAPVPNAPQPPAPPAAPVAPVAPAGAGPAANFGELMKHAQDAQFAGKITPEWFAQQRSMYGITSLPALMQRPDIVECIAAQLYAIAPRELAAA